METLGAKGGKNDRRLSFLNKKRRKKLKQEKLEEKKQKSFKKKQLLFMEKKEEKKVPIKQEEVSFIKDLKKKKGKSKIVVIPTSTIQEKEEEPIIKEREISSFESYEQNKKQDNTIQEKKEESLENPDNFLEKQIVKVIEEDLKEKKYQLKKLDSEIYAIQNLVDSNKDKEELDVMQKEIEVLIDTLERIKKQIIALEKTLNSKFPIEEADNYLIYLVESYKLEKKEEINLHQNLQDNQEYKTLMDRIIELEEKQEEISRKVQEKKKTLELEEEKVESLEDDVLNIEEISKNIQKMMEKQKILLENIKEKVNETVQVNERVEVITKSVHHSILELFLLMSILKHNISMRGNTLAAVATMITLDKIIEMTTPTKEIVTTKSYNVHDYQDMITNCINNTSTLTDVIMSNLNQISSIRYQFEHEYQSCSYLSTYQEALKNLIELENDMKERKEDIQKMKRDMELQLEKNNAKVKSYHSEVI